jgi:hypothetical protein
VKQLANRISAMALGVILLTLPVAAAGAGSSTAGTLKVRVESMLPDGGVVKVARLPDLAEFDVTVNVADTAHVKGLTALTAIQVEVDDVSHPTVITRLDKVAVRVGAYQRLLAIGLSFVVLLLIATLATGGRPLRFLIGLDNRYSNSQSQLVLWFGALAVISVSAVVLRIVYLKWNFVGGVEATANVIALTGLSALSFGGAKVITTQKTSPDTSSGPAQNIPGQLLQPQKTRAAKPKLLTDLFQNDRGDADFGDFQMILVTLAAVGVYLTSCFVFLGDLWPEKSVTLPDIDTVLLSTFGVGQGAYLVKKAAMKPGEG